MTDGPLSSLIEAVRVRNGVAPLWYLHLRRLVASCQTLGVPFPGSFTVPTGGPDRAHRLEVSRRGVVVTERPVGSDKPVRLVTSAIPHPVYRHKTTERSAFARAAGDAQATGADDALLLTSRSEVAEASIWCLFWWEGDQLVAPSLELGILPGVSRMRLEELLGPLTQRRVGLGHLSGRSLLLGNALRGIVEVASLDGVTVPRDARTAGLVARFWP
jgi:branched-subunit amino acid aminotransferase/4-amino-4-deoxychorismate lyase